MTDNNDFTDGLEPIAIVGMACRFPGAADVATFWDNLQRGVESIRHFTPDELKAAGVAPELLNNPAYVPAHASLDDVENFDAEFFGFSPREAAILDPQHRLFLETAWSAIEHAGYDVASMGERCGVIAGVGLNTYLLRNILSHRDLANAENFYSLFVANDKDFLPTRVSYKLDLRGPSFNVNTACSSSLVAVHLACQQLWAYQCDATLAGGVSLQTPQTSGYVYQTGGIVSPDGHCRAFDAAANGTVTGSGVGVVLLKRLSDALAAGDTIHALIAGTASNNDGAQKAGFTAPGVEGQAAAISEAQAVAGFDPASISYVEAHGTGTTLGDPIEISALSQAFGDEVPREGCLIGSVKTNIGHLDTAAGVAGLIKTALALSHEAIPPSLHFAATNPRINFAGSPFRVVCSLTPWPRTTQPRRAGVSSFGIGGSNAHVVLQEAPAAVARAASRDVPRLYVLSARSPAALDRAAQRLAQHVASYPEQRDDDVAYTLARGRRTFGQAAFVVANSKTALAAQLGSAELSKGERPNRAPRIAFLYPGQGAQFVGAGQALYASEPVFRAAFDACAQALIAAGGADIRTLLFTTSTPEADDMLRRTRYAQPALFALGYALTKLWEQRGIKPAAVVGHSAGEYAALVAAGVLNLADAARLITQRAGLMDSMPHGVMAVVGLSEEALSAELPAGLVIAAVNAPTLCTVSGDESALAKLEAALAAKQVFVRRIATSHAFHSPAVEPVLSDFRSSVRTVQFKSPTLAFYSAVSGGKAEASYVADGELWVRQIRQPVRFGQAVQALVDDGYDLLVEIGPGTTLAGLARQASRPAKTIVGGLPAQGDATVAALQALGQVWLAGAEIAWDALFAADQPRRVPLPTYPFERSRHWIDLASKAPVATTTALAATSGQRELSDWFYVPGWQQALPLLASQQQALQENWLVFARDTALDQALIAKLREAGAAVQVVTRGDAFSAQAAHGFSINPTSEADYSELLSHLASHNLPQRVLHLWSLAATDASTIQTEGFNSLLWLTQAFARLGRDIRDITIVTSGLAQVDGSEILAPHQATLLSPVLVIPAEFPGTTCRAIDVLPAANTEHLALHLLAELAAPSSPSLIALRGNRRWQPSFSALPLPATTSAQSPYRQHGTYLITGGLGGMGLLIAEHLARTAQANLVLTGRRSLPPRADWPAIAAQLDHSRITQSLPSLQADINQWLAHITQEMNILTIEQRPGLLETGNRLAAAYALDYFKHFAVAFRMGLVYQQSELYRACRVLPEFERLVKHLLAVLEHDGWLKRDGDSYTVLRDGEQATAAATLHAEAVERFPTLAPTFDVLKHCATQYPQALSGEIPAISVLYPDGSTYVATEAAQRSEEHENHRVIRTLMAELLQRLAARTPDRPLRILEIGGGNGMMAAIVADRLKDENVEYTFTDIGRSFVTAAENKAREAGYDFLRFATFDIGRDPVAQGFALASYDAIIGMDVVHATPVVRATIANLRPLLAEGGLLGLVESARTQRWSDMIWGLAEGWWYAQDTELRLPNSPLITTAGWEVVLADAGFSSVLAYPLSEEERARTDSSLILAQLGTPASAENAATAATVAALLRIEQSGGKVLTAQADVADLAQMQAVVEQAEAQFGAIHGVIHAAAIEAKAVIAARSQHVEDMEFRPKVDGTTVLGQLFDSRPLDFMALCSSITAVVGGAGQLGYCAANAFLDAYAEQRSGNGHYTVAINWGRWQSIGLAKDFESWHAARTGQQLRGGMTPAQGLEALTRILAHRISPRVAVMTAEWRAGISQQTGDQPSNGQASSSHSDANAVEQALRGRAASTIASEATFIGTPLETQLATIWRQILGSQRFDRQTSFQSLGGDSLIAIQMIARIKEQLGVALPIHAAFDCPTIAELAVRIASETAGAAIEMEEGNI